MSTQYNLTTIREFVNAAFNADELNTFCFDHFRAVYDEFVETDRKSSRVRQLVAYAERKGQLERLVHLIQQENPGKYDEFAPRLATAVPTPDKAEQITDADEANPFPADRPRHPAKFNINAPGSEIGAIGEKIHIEGGVHFGPKTEQTGQTVHGDQYNAERDINITKTEPQTAGLPNTKFWVWVLAIGAIIAIIAGIISSISDGLNILGY